MMKSRELTEAIPSQVRALLRADLSRLIDGLRASTVYPSASRLLVNAAQMVPTLFPPAQRRLPKLNIENSPVIREDRSGLSFACVIYRKKLSSGVINIYSATGMTTSAGSDADKKRHRDR